jgi:hypothetical protein
MSGRRLRGGAVKSRGWLTGLGLLAAGCWLPPATREVRVELPSELADSGQELVVLPRIAEVARRVARGVVALELKQGPLRLELPGACPIRIDTREPSVRRVQSMRSLFDVGTSERVVGLGQRFTIVAQPNCREAEGARVSLTHTGGAALTQWSVSADGRSGSGITTTLLPQRSDSFGIVPVSAAEQRRLRAELTLRVELGGEPRERVLGVSAVARSSGLPNVGLSHPLLLSGQGWQLEQKPEESRAQLRAVSGVFELRPDLPGRYRLRDDAGRALSVHSGRFDQMPLDCGRSDCHATIAKSAADSPMTQALASDLGGCHSLEKPECATACHATGEPGTDDGGFAHVASIIGLPALPSEYEELPTALQRLGGVGCMACHGAAAIPEPSARWAVLRSDVCAVCHDAPPRYGHVQALQTSRMAYADREPSTRAPGCARCHTSWGAVGRSAPPAEIGGFGLTCSTCHAVHAPRSAQHKTEHGLLRDLPAPTTLPSPPASFLGVSRVCVSCHAPSSQSSPPEASAAVLVAGQGGIEPTTGEPLSLVSPHSAAPKGCLSCHDSGPEELLLGKNHAFRAGPSACKRCHDSMQARDPSIAARAESLLAKLDPNRPRARTLHAQPRPAQPDPRRERAIYDVLLVLEDPAADIHHPRYARALLDAAERVASGARR